MTPAALTEFLHAHIPLALAMKAEAVSAGTDEVRLRAPLAPNINVHGTMFGGSAATLGLLAGWSVLHLRLKADGIANQLVIHRTDTEYLRPITGMAEAVARLDENEWAGFTHMLERRGRGRLTITAEVLSEGQVAARMTGEFVAIVED